MHMPTVPIVKSLLFLIHTRDHDPPHVTVFYGTPEKFEAKARVVISTGEFLKRKKSESEFSSKDKKLIQKIVEQNRAKFMEDWNETRSKG